MADRGIFYCRSDAVDAMPTVYLFQIDSAENNNAFFTTLLKTLNPSTSFFYKGVACRVGDWIPDGARVDVEGPRCSLTLIELEDTKTEARKSCRKYLPESSNVILRALDEYLDRVIHACQSTGDPRESGFSRLKAMLSQGLPIEVRTACALRSSTEFVEELALIDQPKIVQSDLTLPDASSDETEATLLPFHGVLRLDAERVKALGRCILVLDSVIRHEDHSSATFHSWRNKSPLKRSVKGTSQTPILRKLLFDTQSGLLVELADLWGVLDARGLIAGYFPAASRIRAHDVMNVVFEEARRKISFRPTRELNAV